MGTPEQRIKVVHKKNFSKKGGGGDNLGGKGIM